MPDHPLAEVFGFPTTNLTAEAEKHRRGELCPFHNKVPRCTKDKRKNPLGVCSVYEGGTAVITCPIRFREEWEIVKDAADFFFPPGTPWQSLGEVRLKDALGNSAGNIDFALVAHNERDEVIDFGSLEVQSVYISGNVRQPFEYYMDDRSSRTRFNWSDTSVRPDYVSSSRKRLLPQILYKGSILKAWGKKQAVALQDCFFDTLPTLPTTHREGADIAWFIYRTELDANTNRFTLELDQTVYTTFNAAVEKIVIPEPGAMKPFTRVLQRKLQAKLEQPSLL